ncbi:hypothetical protein E2N92_07725 [Methanofollis formosanus]|uniref:DUF4430 domain-containing protein n=1 Tax=Methanofollis formosanus TaxID=299308 RepID=A0A8G1EGV7_9EURY|nr:hypothetical protein [Methanofollis formosanus]QYZ79322.1 hypothetical protein E2N92_07725 [Methanofollis formosanus]
MALFAVVICAVLLLLPAGSDAEPEVLYDDQVNLTPGTTVYCTPNSGIRYCIDNMSLYGALATSAAERGLIFSVEDRSWNPRLHSQVVSEIAGYRETEGMEWNCTVNGEPVLLSSAEDGICSHILKDGDDVIVFYGKKGSGSDEAGALLRLRVHSLSGHGDATETWNLALKGVSETSTGPGMYASALRCHGEAYTDADGAVWSGVPVWFYIGLVDGEESPHHPMLSSHLAASGYLVRFAAADGTTLTLNSTDLVRNNDYLLAYMKDEEILSGDPTLGPLVLTGAGMDGQIFGGVTVIDLIGFEKPPAPPEVRIVRYARDGVTTVSETAVNTSWMGKHLEVLGHETNPYRFQGPTFDPEDLWNPDENKNLVKIEDAVLGTRLSDLCDLIGGMAPGEEVRLTASDGYVTELAYENLYEPTPRQGEAVLTWWSAGAGYAPAYRDGPRLFFLAPDHTFGNEDMRLCLKNTSWTHYWTEGVQYPSAAGVSVRGVVEVAILPA